MRPLFRCSVALALLWPAVGLAAEPAAPRDFAIALILPKGPRPPSVINVRCLEGCDWAERTIACPEGPEECRTVIASRLLYKPPQKQSTEARPSRPIRDTVCFGVNLHWEPSGKSTRKCETIEDKYGSRMSCTSEEIPAPDGRVYVQDVVAGSPADKAGISVGDLLISINGQAVHSGPQTQQLVKNSRAGQSILVVLERDGAPMTLPGHFGIRMSDGGCAVADARLLEAAVNPEPEPEPELVPFKLIVRGPASGYTIDCLEGCSPGSVDLGGGGVDSDEFAFGLYQDKRSFHIGAPDGWYPEEIQRR